MSKKIIPIKYTSREFDTIKQDLIEHAKRYYPNTYKDFNEGSFGSLMLDTVAYVGDILSFYLDYQTNESFLDTASEFTNITKIAKQMGFKYQNGSTSTGIVTFYVSVPTLNNGADMRYAPVIKKGSTFSTADRTRFILNEDVRFDTPGLDIRPLRINNLGTPSSFAIKSYGRVISGIIKSEVISVGDYKKYLKLKLNSPNIVEILSVLDAEGNEYYEVDYLSQNVIYKSFTNKDITTSDQVKQILKPYLAPRRFTVETTIGETYLQFGGNSDILVSDDKNMLADPGRSVLDLYGKTYISGDSFDPSRIQNSDKLGIAPSNTQLTVTYRYNPPAASINFASDALNQIDNAILLFNNEDKLSSTLISNVKNSLELTNEAPIIGDVSTFDSNELKVRIKNSFSAQSRAVTLEDYKSLCYSMPSKFGSIKRVSITRDLDVNKRNLNMYILSEDGEGRLSIPNQILKNNLKMWVTKNKMINDSIDIYDGKIINYSIEFTAIGMPEKSKYDVLSEAIDQLKKDFVMIPDFGEPFVINNILLSLRKVSSILDVINVSIYIKNGGRYSISNFDMEQAMSQDKRYINVPYNAIMELKYPNSDIKGTIL